MHSLQAPSRGADETPVLKPFPSRFALLALLLLTAMSAHAATATTTALTASATTIAHGTVLTLTATVAAGATHVSPGSVRFCDAAFTNCRDLGVINRAQLKSTGVAAYKFIPGIGTHTYKAVFAGTNSYTTSTSTSVTVTVTGTYPSTTTIAAIGSAGSYTLTGTVVTTSNPSGATGSIDFTDTTNANYPLGTRALGAPVQTQGFTTSATNAAAGARLLTAGDFNNDGIPDYAVALSNTNQVAVYLGQGNGTYVQASGSPYAVGSVPVGVVAGDFNNDGKLDLAVSNYSSNSVSILLGNGDGTFQAATTAGTVLEATALVAVDMNGDGNLDLAICSPLLNTVAILDGNGDGTFGTTLPALPTGSQPYAIAVADFNNDGVLDIAVANFGSTTVTVLLGNGLGLFTPVLGSPFTVGSAPSSVVAADINNDGIPDLLVGNGGSSSVTVLKGTGTGAFTIAATLATVSNSVKGVAIVDFNRDGKTDIALAEAGGTMSLYPGNGDLTFGAPVTYTPGSNGYDQIVVLDSDGDGVPDYLIPANNSNTVVNVLGRYVQTATAVLTPIAVPGGGTHNVTASYAGDGISAASVSSPVAPTATPTATALILTAAPASSTYSDQVVLTATLSPYQVGAELTNGENITFRSGGVSIGTGVLSSGVATFTTTSLPVGVSTLSAVYTADTNFVGSTSSNTFYTVTKNTPGITWPIPASITYGTPLTATQLNATASAAGTFVYAPAAGTVLNAGTQPLSLTFTPTSTANYNSNTASNSIVVTQASGLVLLSAATNPIAYGSLEQFNATVSANGTGSVTFKDGAATLNTTSLSGGAATFSTAALATGSHSITVTWPGDGNYTAATSSVLTVTVQKAPIGIAAASSRNPSVFGDALTFIWTCTGTLATPTGSLLLKDGATTLATIPLDGTGKGTFTLSTLAASVHNLTVTYSGDTNYN